MNWQNFCVEARIGDYLLESKIERKGSSSFETGMEFLLVRARRSEVVDLTKMLELVEDWEGKKKAHCQTTVHRSWPDYCPRTDCNTDSFSWGYIS